MAQHENAAADEAATRMGLVANECFEALDHLRRAIDYAAGGDAYMRRLLGAMREVADLVDHVVAEQGQGPARDHAVGG